jgi:spore germination cell wall hydrolase CwlJ-like protein
MRRCYLGVALVVGGIFMTSFASSDSCSFGMITTYAAEDTLTEEMAVAFQEEVQTGEEYVETDIPAEEIVVQPEEEMVTELEAVQTESNNFGLEEQEYQVLLKIVEAEAGGEDTTGKILVANVVMNRVRSGSFPNSVSEVVYERNGGRAQFSPTVDGRINTVSVSQDTVDAVARVMNGEDLSQGALYFRSVRSSNGWFDRALNRVCEHGNHIFYTL